MPDKIVPDIQYCLFKTPEDMARNIGHLETIIHLFDDNKPLQRQLNEILEILNFAQAERLVMDYGDEWKGESE